MFENPFKTAEDYIRMRKLCAPFSMAETARRINDMILMPMITLFLLFSGDFDPVSLLSVAFATYRSWSEWLRYHTLRNEMQNMYLHAMRVGGPFIVTNDSNYMPYVWADAVVRTQ